MQVYRATLKHDLIPPSHSGPRRKPSADTPFAPAIPKDSPPSAPTATVAIKILHPHISETISRDLSIMHFFASIVSSLPGMKWLSLTQEVRVFGTMMNQQLDLRIEADNLLVFENNFAHRNLPVTFPRPFKIWSTKDLLVEEFQNALPMESLLKNGFGPYNEQVASIGLDALLACLFRFITQTDLT